MSEFSIQSLTGGTLRLLSTLHWWKILIMLKNRPQNQTAATFRQSIRNRRYIETKFLVSLRNFRFQRDFWVCSELLSNSDMWLAVLDNSLQTRQKPPSPRAACFVSASDSYAVFERAQKHAIFDGRKWTVSTGLWASDMFLTRQGSVLFISKLLKSLSYETISEQLLINAAI